MRKVLLEHIIREMKNSVRGYHYLIFFHTKSCSGLPDNLLESFPDALPISFKYINGVRNATISITEDDAVVVNCIFNGIATTFRCPLGCILKIHDYFTGEGVVFESYIYQQNVIKAAEEKQRQDDEDNKDVESVDDDFEKKVVEKNGRKFTVYINRRKTQDGK